MIVARRQLPRVHSERLIMDGRCGVRPKRNPYGPILGCIVTSRNDERVDCRICMYWLGLYMPLTKLYDHQVSNMKRCSFQKEFFDGRA